MSKRWHTIAMEMLDRGESHKFVAFVFGVSTSMIAQIRKRDLSTLRQVPDWVPSEFHDDFKEIMDERGMVVAKEWLKYAVGVLNRVPLQPRDTHPWNARQNELVP